MSKRTITKITQAHAVAICRRGANPQAHVLLRKSADSTPSSSSKEPDMSIKSLQKIAAFDEATRKHFTGLDEAAATAFLEKSAEDQAAEVAKAASDAQAAAAAADAAKAASDQAGGAAGVAKTATGEVDIAKAIADGIAKAMAPMTAELAELKKTNATHELRKSAASPEFKGYPGGEEAVFKKLESIAGLSDDQRAIVVDSMKAHATAAQGYTGSFGAHVMTDISKSGVDLIEKKAEDLRKSDPNLSKEQAIAKALEDDALLLKALEEEDAG